LVRLKIKAKKPMSYLLLEDRLPAGFEVVDRGKIDYYDWNYWYADKDVRDEKVSFYISHIEKGEHTIEYQMRASTPGSYNAMPTQIFSMYQPEIRSSTYESSFRVDK
jgi:alpha-2-macroglobulin